MNDHYPVTAGRAWRSAIERGRPLLRPALAATAGSVATLAANVALVGIAGVVGITTGHLAWSISAAEAVVLIGGAVAALLLARRSGAEAGAGLLVGWATAFFGLMALVVAVAVAAAVALFLLIVAWVLLVVFGWLFVLLLGGLPW